MPGDGSGVKLCLVNHRFMQEDRRGTLTGNAQPKTFICMRHVPGPGCLKNKVRSVIGAVGYVCLGPERFNLFGLASETELAQLPAGLSIGEAMSELLLPELEKTKGQSLLGGIGEAKRPDDVRVLVPRDTENAIR